MKIDDVYIIAEVSCNHGGDLLKAKRLVCEAKKSGADAVKFQYFRPELITKDCKDERFVINSGLWQGKTLYELYKEARTPLNWIPTLKDLAEKIGLDFILSIYDPETIEEVERYNIDIYKISSFEINYLELIEKAARTRKILMLSTGMADYKEILDAVETIRVFHNNFYLLKCTSEYPAPIEHLNLKTILAMRRAFKCDIGFSDHTDGVLAPVVAISMGAKLIEKHIKLDNDCLDAEFSIFPEQFSVMVQCARGACRAIGEVKYGGDKQFRRKEIDGRMVRAV